MMQLLVTFAQVPCGNYSSQPKKKQKRKKSFTTLTTAYIKLHLLHRGGLPPCLRETLTVKMTQDGKLSSEFFWTGTRKGSNFHFS